METKILYAYCPACDYQNTCVTDRKYRRSRITVAAKET